MRVRPNILSFFEFEKKWASRFSRGRAVVHYAEIKKTNWLKLAPHTDACLVLLSQKADRKFLSNFPKLKALGVYAVGTNNVDLAHCRERKIAVINTPDVLTRSTAELTLGLLLAAARRFPEGQELIRRKRFNGWAPDLLLGHEIFGKRATIVGAGKIGSQVAELFGALGISVTTLSSRSSESEIREALKSCDILSFHCPLTPQTHHWLDARRMDFLKPGVVVLNVARGPVVDEAELVRRLKSGKIAAAGLDVYEREPKVHRGLLKLKNVVLLPHLGSATVEARLQMLRILYEGTLGVLEGRKPTNLVGSISFSR